MSDTMFYESDIPPYYTSAQELAFKDKYKPIIDHLIEEADSIKWIDRSCKKIPDKYEKWIDIWDVINDIIYYAAEIDGLFIMQPSEWNACHHPDQRSRYCELARHDDWIALRQLSESEDEDEA